MPRRTPLSSFQTCCIVHTQDFLLSSDASFSFFCSPSPVTAGVAANVGGGRAGCWTLWLLPPRRRRGTCEQHVAALSAHVSRPAPGRRPRSLACCASCLACLPWPAVLFTGETKARAQASTWATLPSRNGTRTAPRTLAPCLPCSKRSTFSTFAPSRWVASGGCELCAQIVCLSALCRYS